MSVTEKVTPGLGLVVKKTGIFNFEEIYQEVAAWLTDFKYDFVEKEHTHKDQRKGNEIKIVFQAIRDIDEFARFSLTCTINVKQATRKDKMFSGLITIVISSQVILDYKDEYAAKPFGNFLLKLYRKIRKAKIEGQYITKLGEESDNLQDELKGLVNTYQ